MCDCKNIVANERVGFMNDLRAIRDEIRSDLQIHRKEHREDVKELRELVDLKFTALSSDFQAVRDDVAMNKARVGMIGAFFGVVAGSVSAWFVTNLGGGS